MDWSRIATDQIQPEDCLVFSDWLLDQGDERRAVGLRRMVRDRKWPKVWRTLDHRPKTPKERVLAQWFPGDVRWFDDLGLEMPTHYINRDHLAQGVTWMSVGSKTFWVRDGWRFCKVARYEAQDPVVAALQFISHRFGGLPE